MVCRSNNLPPPLKRGLNFFSPLPTAYLPQQTKNGFAGDPGRGGLNNSALRARLAALKMPHVSLEQKGLKYIEPRRGKIIEPRP